MTKDSGAAGGVKDKVEAARLRECSVVIVNRPPDVYDGAYDSIDALIEGLKIKAKAL